GIAVIAAIGIGTGGAEHGATDEGERGGKAAATPRARRVVIHRVVARIERDVVLVVVLGRLSVVFGVVRLLVVVMLGLLVRPEMQLAIEPAVGASALGLRSRRMRVIPARGVARRMTRPLAPAALRVDGGKLRLMRRGALPVVRRGRWRVVRLLLPLARMTSPEVSEWIALPEQTCKLGQRIAGACLLARPRRLGCATIWITGAIGS